MPHTIQEFPDAAKNFQRLIDRLMNPELYDHPAAPIAKLETHISTVLLAGDYAYKLKKPYNLGFLDFTTLAARQHFCQEELRLNRRLAPDLYLDVVAISGTHDAPLIGSEGVAIEYAVKMRRFPQEQLLSNVLQRGDLQPEQLDRLARRIAEFHAALPGANAAQAYGEPDTLHAATRQNFNQIAPLISSAKDRAQLEHLRQLSEALFTRDLPLFRQRKQQGFIREGHGDLHLGNMALIDTEIVPFDCIEFNDSFRWNDVMSEVAFVVMDLASRGRPDFGFRFLNTYLEQTGDFAGLRVLRYYLMFRAVVRAKIAAFLASQAETSAAQRTQAWQDYHHYLDLAEQFSHAPPFLLVLMHGLSGSGKSTLARELAAQLPAIHVRSDVERKRLFGFNPLARTAAQPGAQPGAGIYSAEATQRTYARLTEIAREAQAAGYAAILDATFLSAQQRAAFHSNSISSVTLRWLPRSLLAVLNALSSSLARRRLVSPSKWNWNQAPGSNTWIVSCTAPEAVLRARVGARFKAGTDAAEADLAVLERQLATHDALTAAELQHSLVIDTQQAFDAGALAEKLRRSTLEH